MISYEDARQIREKANAPLTWDETIPAPPIDRIELTRRILETAEAVGLDFPTWDESFPFDDPDKKMEAFQKRLRRIIRRQTFSGIPQGTHGQMRNGGFHQIILLTHSGGEYIEQLENDYYKPWEMSWVFGGCGQSKQNVTALLKDCISQIHEYDSEGCYTNNLKYRDAEKIDGSEVIADYLSLNDGWNVSHDMRGYVGSEIALVENRWLGLPELWADFLPLALGLLGCIISIVGAVQGRYSGWLLIVIIPVVIIPAMLIVFLLLTFEITLPTKKRWCDKTMTFDELAEKVVALKTREWAELQQTYTAQ